MMDILGDVSLRLILSNTMRLDRAITVSLSENRDLLRFGVVDPFVIEEFISSERKGILHRKHPIGY